jgi:large subunit ribosomal protein L13
MTKIIDGKNAILGRLSSYAAKEVLRGEEVVILNSDKVIITGSKKEIEAEYHAKRNKTGTIQTGPKIPRSADRVVKRTIRGMLPNHRYGRGKEALKRVKCYKGIPKEFEGKKCESYGKERTKKYVTVEHVSK